MLNFLILGSKDQLVACHDQLMAYQHLLNGVTAIDELQQSLLELMSDKKTTPPEEQDFAQKLDLIKKICLDCKRCGLRKACQQVVFGRGNPGARLMLVGEGPGGEDDRQGLPFVGRAGQLLDRILDAAQIKQEEVYITNVVKCRPPANRQPFHEEVNACLPHLQKQIELLNPEIIVCLGVLASRSLINKSIAITRCRGQWYKKEGRSYMATFHPAALLRDPGKKKFVWEDFKQIAEVYNYVDNGGCN